MSNIVEIQTEAKSCFYITLGTTAIGAAYGYTFNTNVARTAKIVLLFQLAFSPIKIAAVHFLSSNTMGASRKMSVLADTLAAVVAIFVARHFELIANTGTLICGFAACIGLASAIKNNFYDTTSKTSFTI